MKLIRILLIQQAIYLVKASAVELREHSIVQRDESTRLLSTTTSSWSNILALICPPHLKHCPHHKDKQESSNGEDGSGATDTSTSSATSSSTRTSSTTDNSTSDTSSSGSTSDSSSSSWSSSTSSGGSESTSSTTTTTTSSSSSSSTTVTDDTDVDDTSTVYYKKTTDDNVLEEENNATKDIVGGMDLGFLYIVGAAVLVAGLAMAVVQKRKRSTANIEGSRTGLIDITEDPESAFVAMEMAGIDNNNDNFGHTSTPSSDIYTDIDDVVVEYGVKM